MAKNRTTTLLRTPLEEFLNQPRNMHAREQILMHRLFLDLKTAAAQRGYYLNTYFDDVDQDGFDVIFDDHDHIKKIQVKSVGKGSPYRILGYPQANSAPIILSSGQAWI